MPIYGRSGVTNVVDSQTLHVSYLYTSSRQLVFLQVFRHTAPAIRTCDTVLIHCGCVIRCMLFKPLRLET